MNYRKVFLIVMIAALSPLVLWGQGAPSFTASTDARQVLENSYLEITFTIKNAEGENFKRPKFNNFKVISGPNRSMVATSVNGVMSQEESFSFTLLPRKLGKLTIGSAEVTIAGKVFRTRPIQVEVLKASNNQLKSGEEVFIRLIPSDTIAVVGQKILIYYKLYTQKNISNFGLIEEPKFDGFFSTEERNTDYRTSQEIIEGQQYTTKIMKTMAIFPQRAGNLVIDPLLAEVAISDGRRRLSFFNQGRRVSLSSEPFSIQVNSLPEDAPISFSGAVGNFTMSTTSGKNRLTTDDVVSISMKISGEGDMKRVQVPEFEYPESFEKYDPSIRDIEQKTFNQTLVVGKEIEYLFVPQKPGTFSIRPEFSYFSPDSMAYVTIAGPTYTYIVTQGKNKPKISLNESNDTANKELGPIKKTSKLHPKSSPFLFSKIYSALFGLPILAFIVGIWIQQNQKDEDDIDEEERKRRKAQKVALERLKTAKEYLAKPQESKVFYDEISKALLGFVCSKLDIPFSALKKSELFEQLQQLDIPDHLINDFTDVLKNSEMALYAGLNNEAAMQESFQKAENVLTNIEVFLRSEA